MRFVDEALIEVRAGCGGDGCVAFRREKHLPRGGPSGGDGGRGGDVWLVADRNLNTLVEYRYAPLHRAGDGAHGRGSDQFGRAGRDLELRVPVGTIVREAESGELIADLAREGERALVARGGRGGRGNLHFKSSTNRAPRQATRGEPGERRRLALELRVLADVGLVGMPNAGKSTFLRAVSAARPKVADYPFTTLEPHLGVVRPARDCAFVVADIPGLIEGAAEGAGLGHRFLRHVARTRLLLHLVDIAPCAPQADPVHAVRAVAAELRKYDPELGRRPRWLVFNKCDAAADAESRIARALRRLRWRGPWFRISALTGEGCAALCRAVARHLAAGAKPRKVASR